jgi:hypothetical protein
VKAVVLDLANFSIPLKIYGNDGNKPVPEGGILLLSAPPSKGDEREFSIFESEESAAEAVARTVAHGQAHNYGETWAAHMFKVVALDEYRAMGRKRRKADPKEIEA